MSNQCYAPDALLLRHGVHACHHCGLQRCAHHGDGRCYTALELAHRLSFYLRTRRWPEPDEGCTLEEVPHG